jgi:hypothetical protein
VSPRHVALLSRVAFERGHAFVYARVIADGYTAWRVVAPTAWRPEVERDV